MAVSEIFTPLTFSMRDGDGGGEIVATFKAYENGFEVWKSYVFRLTPEQTSLLAEDAARQTRKALLGQMGKTSSGR